MFQQEELILKAYEEGQTYLKFIRRPDIPAQLRLYIAGVALFEQEYGQITALSRRYKISRTFIYELRNKLLISGCVVFGMSPNTSKEHKSGGEKEEQLALLREILSLRLEGKCPIIGISLLLKRRGLKSSSIGYVSQVLKEIGSSLSPVLEGTETLNLAVVFASDEVFSSNRPLLITVDPISSAILRMELGKDRKSDSWETHWNSLLASGFMPILLTNDDGTGMKSAQVKALKGIARQGDVYHGIAHRLGDICRILEQKAWASAKKEYDKERNIESVVKEDKVEKRFAIYEQAKLKSKKVIELYDDFKLYYEYMIEQFQVFDEQGNPRKVEISKENLEEGIAAMETLGHSKANKELKTIHNLKDSLFYFLGRANKVVQFLKRSCTNEGQKKALKAVCRAYQYQKNYRKVKKATSKKYYRKKEAEWLMTAQLYLGNYKEQTISFEDFKKQCYQQLDTIVQSSAMVETINSIVRMYLNSCKNQINQPFLNLIMFYHNHRRYVQGKRKNFTPMELLTGQKQEKDWLDLMLLKVGKAA